MIPKIIHYCWFGENQLPELEQNCISTWKKKLPDYEIKLWNESNSDLNSCEYVRQAYENKKYAFVSDFIRIKALYEYGGIYFDTDVEVLKSFDPFLVNNAFLGFENRTCVGTAVIGSEKGISFAKEMLDYYYTHPFVDCNGHLNLTTNVSILNDLLEKKGLIRENKEQIVGDIHVYERSFFFPKKKSEEVFLVTDQTVAIHKMSATWLTKRQKNRGTNKFWINVCRPTLRFFQNICFKLVGEQTTKNIELKIRNILK